MKTTVQTCQGLKYAVIFNKICANPLGFVHTIECFMNT